MTDQIKRTTLIVRDADKAAAWYETVFGMTRWMDTPFTLSGSQLAAGKKGDRTRLVILKAQHDLIGMIGLLEWLDPKIDAPDKLPTEITIGMPIFVVASEDARGALSRAQKLGSVIHSEPRDWTVTGADGKKKDMVCSRFLKLSCWAMTVTLAVASATSAPRPSPA